LKYLFLFILFIFSLDSEAKLFAQWSVNYDTSSESEREIESTRIRNLLFFGGAITRKGNLFLGQSVHSWSTEEVNVEGAEAEEVGVLELGPRFILFFSEAKTFYVHVAYHPYAKGTRVLNGVETEIDGTSTLYGIGLQLKASRRVYWGFSINMHNYSIAEETTEAGATTEVTDSYSYIFPSIEFSWRF